MQKKEISIVIPILNEEKNIFPLTKKIISDLKKIKFEIIFVDDNSTDNSKRQLNLLKAKYSFFNPIFRKKNPRDLTQSCFLGIEKAKYRNILIMDGDMQHDPKYINKMINLFNTQNLDLVIGARKLKHGPNKGLSETRRFASLILIFLFSFFKIKTSDPMSGFFLFKKEIYLKNKNYYFGKGFKILADVLVNSKTSLKVKDVFINFEKRLENRSKMNFKILSILIFFYFKSVLKKLFI
ncbi:glycosyltransferase group 2 [alpha proteobacterium HIMB5]|nr:glycosyltransferase group 2 [alpha proteobacterium HIMB5]